MPDENEEAGFVVRDRRRFLSETPAPEAPATPSVPEPPAPPEPVAPITTFSTETPLLGEDESEDSDDGEIIDSGGDYDDSFDGDDESAGEIPDVYSILALFLGEMQNLAVIRMGLAPNPVTGEPAADLSQARIAIDTIAFLASQLEPVVSPEEKAPLKSMVRDLQMAFVEMARQQSGGIVQ